jgi:hypothetical protein
LKRRLFAGLILEGKGKGETFTVLKLSAGFKQDQTGQDS